MMIWADLIEKKLMISNGHDFKAIFSFCYSKKIASICSSTCTQTVFESSSVWAVAQKILYLLFWDW